MSDDYFLLKRTRTLCNEIRESNENEQTGQGFKFDYKACNMTAVEASIMIS